MNGFERTIRHPLGIEIALHYPKKTYQSTTITIPGIHCSFWVILLGLGLPIQGTNGCKSFLGYKEGTLVSFIDENNQYRYEIKNGIRDEYEDRTCMFFLL